MTMAHNIDFRTMIHGLQDADDITKFIDDTAWHNYLCQPRIKATLNGTTYSWEQDSSASIWALRQGSVFYGIMFLGYNPQSLGLNGAYIKSVYGSVSSTNFGWRKISLT